MNATSPANLRAISLLCNVSRHFHFILLVTWLVLSPVGAISAADNKKLGGRTATFVAEKRAQIEKTCSDAERPVPKLVRDFFSAASRADWHTATNAAERALRFGESGGAESNPELWEDLTRVRQPLMEALGIIELYREMDPKFFNFLGEEITKCIPAGSIYFGGSDAGRFLPTVFSESQVEGRPFFTITQNQLADGTYLTYVMEIYGKKIKVPTTEDSQQCFQEYLSDAQRRIEHDRKYPNEPAHLKPNEEVKIIDNRVQVSGAVAVMAINGLLVKTIFDKNFDYEFYIEESYPIDWMYPHLVPHQFIFKINRTPLSKIPPEVIQSDRQLWTKQADALIGPWLRTNTPLAEVIDFIEQTYKRKELKSFKGDRLFVKDGETQKAFGRMRAAVAGLYAWHAGNAKNDVERQRLDGEAEFAFRQAVAIGPVSPDAVPRFAYRLRDRGDVTNALRLARLAIAIDPDEEKLKPLLKEFEERSRAKRTTP
jgi:hypothetical protein